MSLWSGFKKKLDEGWSGADFWDKNENQQQRQAFVDARPAPVIQPQQIQTRRVQPNATVQNLFPTQPTQNTVSEEFVNKQEAPKQNLWDKFKDQVDPNSEADIYRRTQAGNDAQYKAKGGVTGIAKTIARPFTETADAALQGARFGAGVITGNDQARDSAERQFKESASQSFPGMVYKPAEDMAVNALYHYPRAAIAGGNPLSAGYDERYNQYLKDNNLTGNMIRDTVAPAAETALNILTLGQASALGTSFKSGIQNSGIKTAIKQAIPQFTKTTAANTVQGGAMELYEENPTAMGATKKAAMGAGYGTIGDIAMAGVPSYIKAKGGENKIARILEGGSTDINPNGKNVQVGFSDELKNSTGISPQMERIKANTIEMGGDTKLSNIDPQTVAKYVEDIKAGRPIDPLIITREGGKTLLQDGKHRLAALQALGVEDVPIVTRDLVKVAQSTPMGVAPKFGNLGEMPDFRARSGVVVNSTAELSKKYGLKEDTIVRMTRQYGEAKTQNMLARTSDASNIKNKDAFFVSEMRKNFGSPNMNIKRGVNGMSPEELASLEKTAPQVGKTVDSEKTAPMKIVSRVDPESGQMLNTFEARKEVATPAKQTVKISNETSNLGKIAKDFYASKKGNQKIGLRDIERLKDNVSRQVDDAFKAIGSDFRDVARKVNDANRDGVFDIDLVNLDPAETALWKKVQDELDYVRRRNSTGKREISENDRGSTFFPNQKVGKVDTLDTLYKDMKATKPGNEYKRLNKIAQDDLDYSPEVIGQYVARYGETKLYRQERIAKALEKDNVGVDQKQINLAAQKLINATEKVNKVESEISAHGLGRRKQLADGKFVDIAADLTDVGRTLGHKITTVADAPKGLTNGEKINSVSIDGVPLGTKIGLNQYRDAKSFAAKHFADSQGNRQALTDMMRQKLLKDYNMRPDEVEYSIAAIERINDDIPPQIVQERVQGIYQDAAKQMIMRESQFVDITNPKLRKEVSLLTNQILREGTLQASTAQKVVGTILKVQNGVFRKLNPGTAINETGDFPGLVTIYGVKGIRWKPDFNRIKEFGLGDIDPAIQPYLDKIAQGADRKTVIKSINDKTNLYRFVEHYKAAVVADSAYHHYRAAGLKGDLLTAKVLEDYRNYALPQDLFTKTVLDNAPLYTQYMSWGARNLQKEGRLLTGKVDAGKLADKTQWERIARNAYVNLPAKTVFWLSSNALKGTALMTAFGITDFTGLTNQDYSGIEDEDKSPFDKAAHYTNISTTMSLLNSIYQSYEKEQLKNSDKYKDANYNPYADNNLVGDIADKYTPSTVKNVVGANKLTEKGFSDNQDSFSDIISEGLKDEDKGRIQYEAPDDAWNTIKSYLFGKSQTDKGREYNGNEDVFRRGISQVGEMAKESIGLKDRDYNRPITQEYTDQYRATGNKDNLTEVDKQARTALLEGGRKYNDFLDDLKKTDKGSHDNYILAIDGKHVSPEYWKTIVGDDAAKSDLSTFKMMRERKKQAAKDLGKEYDPIYDLSDDQARSVLQQKATATGDDIALRNALYKEQWYQDYTDRLSEFYGKQEDKTDSDYKTSDRVKEWYKYNKSLTDTGKLREKNGSAPAWASEFPTVYQQKVISDTYGFKSDESNAWFKSNADQYQAEKAVYDARKLEIINKMREIEGYPPMSADQYEQVTEIADTDKSDDKKKGYGSGGGGGGVYAKAGDFGEVRGLSMPSAKIKVSKVKIKPRNKSKYVKIQTKKA